MQRKHISNYKIFLETFRKINEGGGAGIQFNSEYSGSVSLEVNNGVIKLLNNNIQKEFEISAKGYEDGGKTEEEITMMVATNYNYDKLAEYLKAIKISDIIYGVGEENTYKNFETTEENISLFDYSKTNKLQIEVSIDINYSPMYFAGWIRGTFEKDDIVFDNNNYNNSEHSHVYFNNVEFYQTKDYKYDFTQKKLEIHETGISSENILDLFIPTVKASEDFIIWYQDTFENQNDDDDIDFDDESYN